MCVCICVCVCEWSTYCQAVREERRTGVLYQLTKRERESKIGSFEDKGAKFPLEHW